MKFTVQRNLLKNVAAVRFERGAEVVDIDAADLGHHPVGNARGNAAHPEIVDAVLAPSADDVVTGSNLFQKDGNVVGIVLQIAIHGDDVFPARVIESGGKSCSLTEVAPQFDHRHATVDRRDLAQHGEGVVA